ncbi:MAG: carboxypeptidase regulatory-like domain-containing protein, partial [Acidobacteriaceae bacterium]
MHRISTARLRNSLLAVFLLAMLAFLTPAFSQSTSTSGSIKGNITDPQGAAVPGATVVTTNTGTGFSRTVTSGGQGEFTVADIPIGSYGVTITKPGFKEFDLKNVIVNVSNISNVIANLQLGNVSEQVTVEASAIQVQTSSAAVGEVVDGRQVAELPLNGSNFVELTQLQPGVSHANNFSTANKGLLGGVDFSVNGNPVTNNLFLIDGATNNDVGSNRTILVYPSVDAIAEFKMLRNSYGPEYGQASGAVISIVTKGGTNQFHGTVTYYGRNDAVGAEDYFAKEHNNAVVAAGGRLPHNGKDELRRNDVIWSLGGPIKKDKLFFFVSQEFNREIQGYTRSSCVPSAAELSGDFSGGTSCGAALPTGIPVADQAPGNPLKIANPSPAGLLIGQLLPTPNTPPSVATGGNNWFLSTGSPLNFREENARVDYNVAANQLLTFRYTQDHWVNPAPNTAPNGYLWGDDPFPAVEGNWSQPSKSAIAKLTSTIGSSMVNEAQFSYAGNAIVTTAGGSTPGLAQKINGAFPTVFPGSVKGLNGIPTIWGGLGAYGNGANLWSIAPYANNMDLYTVRDDISKIKGSHAIKAGVFLSFNAKNENQYGGQDRPAFSTADAAWAISNPTGNQLADLLLPGQAFSMGEQNINPVDQARWRDYEFYVGDTWKAKPNLTIEYGARYSFYREPVDATNAVGIFSPAAFDPAAINVPGPGGTTGPNICNGIVVVPGTTFCQQAANLTGFAYTAGTPSPYGRALVPNANHDIAPRLGISWDPFNTGKTAIRAGVGQFYQRERVSTQVGISNSPPFAITVNSNRTLDAVPPASTIVYGGGGSNSRNPRSVTPNSWQWNLMVEQELAKNTALEVGYIGNKGIHLTSIYDQNATNDRANGAFNANGALNPFRPYPTFGAIYTADRNGWSNYHALQVLFRTRWEDHVNVQVAYTWSHSISNIDLAASNGLGANASNITDPLNPNLDKGNSTINRPQMLVTNATFYLPKLNGANGLERNVLGGWELATIASFEDGNSITAYAVTNGQFSNLFGT